MRGDTGEFIPFPTFAMSNYHHMALGSHQRNRPDTPENLHRPAHEFFSDDQLRIRMAHQISLVRNQRSKFGGSTNDEILRRLYSQMWYELLLPNLRYLEAIKRLSEEIDLMALEAELKMPD